MVKHFLDGFEKRAGMAGRAIEALKPSRGIRHQLRHGLAEKIVEARKALRHPDNKLREKTVSYSHKPPIGHSKYKNLYTATRHVTASPKDKSLLATAHSAGPGGETKTVTVKRNATHADVVGKKPLTNRKKQRWDNSYEMLGPYPKRK